MPNPVKYMLGGDRSSQKLREKYIEKSDGYCPKKEAIEDKMIVKKSYH